MVSKTNVSMPINVGMQLMSKINNETKLVSENVETQLMSKTNVRWPSLVRLNAPRLPRLLEIKILVPASWTAVSCTHQARRRLGFTGFREGERPSHAHTGG